MLYEWLDRAGSEQVVRRDSDKSSLNEEEQDKALDVGQQRKNH